ncbi:peptidase M10A protein [Marine Group I thaumarchaeote SCGC AAA799-P11]|uniref:Peptidase M10A protein n=1 Tax=Marine Group I thaumarchaeote SCGC AAA799-P11 TaxID=1502295 RepID=A0A087RZB0_9ARCH|nr:peptidase M10A protein [Marine Group I thaumarchaeote SCGC AAA799-P11]
MQPMQHLEFADYNDHIAGIDFLEEPQTIYKDELRSGYFIQNLRGDTIDTWISWNVVGDDLFHVHLQDSPEVTDRLQQAVVDVIMSDDSFLIDDSEQHKGPKGTVSRYYLGWQGALNSIDANTERDIPKNLHFHVTDKCEGNVIIYLKNYASADGFSGFTNSIVDESNNQILKSTITIYDVDSLSAEGFKTILRHELGHSFGLAHSTAQEDLMHPVILTNYPYISDCTLDGIIHLYDNNDESSVVCDK